MRRFRTRSALHESPRPSLVERELVTVAAQALMKVGIHAAIRTDSFMVRITVASLSPFPRPALSDILFPSFRLFHQSSPHRCTSTRFITRFEPKAHSPV